MEYQPNKMREEIAGVDADRLLNTDSDELVITSFAEKFAKYNYQIRLGLYLDGGSASR